MFGCTWSWPLADRQMEGTGQPWGTGTLVSCRAGRQGGQGVKGTSTKKRTTSAPRISLSANAQLGTQRPMRTCLCACVQSNLSQHPVYPCLGSHIREGHPRWPLPGHTSRRKRKGSASGSHGLRCVPHSWHPVSYCSFQLGTPSSSAERTQMKRQWGRVEETKIAPCQSQSREQ